MAVYTLDEYATLLARTFAPYRPRVIKDVTDKGVEVMEFILPHPQNPRFSVSLQASETRGFVETCALWFGQAEISGRMDVDMVVSAIEEIVSDRVVAVLRYKNQDAFDNHRPSGKQWLYQLSDDEDDDTPRLEAMKQRLQSPPTFGEKISGQLLGVFEIFSWSEDMVIPR